MRRIFCIAVLWILAAIAVPAAFGQTVPAAIPVGSEGVRVAAEWEPAVGVLIAWPLKIPRALVIELAKDVTVHCMVSDQANEQKARKTFEEWGIPAKRMSFIAAKQGATYCWTRDWGPFAVFDAAGKYQLVDGRFHGYPRSGIDSSKGFSNVTYKPFLDVTADDAAPGAIAKALGMKRTELPIAMTGGNIVFDGLGTGFATQLLVDENISMGISKDRFVRMMKNELGVTQFHFLPNFESYQGNQHADCLLKLLDEERILIKRAPPDYHDGQFIEAVVQQLGKLKNIYGRPYTILRIDTPRYFKNLLANYTNSLILNRKIYVPMFGIPGDEPALKTWRAAMPGYEVLGFTADKPGAAWRYSDALHCRTRAVWDQKMLFLAHKRLAGVVPASAKYSVDMQIRDYSGAGLIEDKLKLAWRTAGSAKWTFVGLKAQGKKHTFRSMIEGVQQGQTVEYYLSAASQSGRHETLPRTAPKGFYSFTVEQKR